MWNERMFRHWTARINLTGECIETSGRNSTTMIELQSSLRAIQSIDMLAIS